MKSLLFIFSLTFTLSASADLKWFSNGKLRFIEDGKTKVVTSPLCRDEAKNLLLSQSCQKNKNCEAKRERFLPPSYQSLDESIGDPLFKYCYLFDGTPALVEYQLKKEWRETSICKFKDKSFINLSYLHSDGINFNPIE